MTARESLHILARECNGARRTFLISASRPQLARTLPGRRSSTSRWIRRRTFQHPQAGHIRYTITLDRNGDWHEIGERSPDGKTAWVKFIEMQLTRSPVAP